MQREWKAAQASVAVSLHWQKPKFDYETSPRADDGYSRSRKGVGATAQRRHKGEKLIGRGAPKWSYTPINIAAFCDRPTGAD